MILSIQILSTTHTHPGESFMYWWDEHWLDYNGFYYGGPYKPTQMENGQMWVNCEALWGITREKREDWR